MTWSPQQAAMLQAMGVRLWAPQPQPPVLSPEAAPQAAPRGPATPAVPPRGAQAFAPAAGARTPATASASASAPAPAPAPASTRAPAQAPVRAPTAAGVAARAPAPAAAPTLVPVAMPALAGLGWTEVRDTVAACRACGLCEGRRQTVFGTGHPHAHWMLVGEAPGELEDEHGEPFAGASGQLLDRMLHALNLTRAADGPAPPSQRAFVTHALKCRPPRNRNPTAAELAQCGPYLARQVELLKPRVILAMGPLAVMALLRSDEPVGRLRGRVHHCQGVPLVVTYHPTYLLRQRQDKAGAWEDLCLAAQVAEAGPPG